MHRTEASLVTGDVAEASAPRRDRSPRAPLDQGDKARFQGEDGTVDVKISTPGEDGDHDVQRVVDVRAHSTARIPADDVRVQLIALRRPLHSSPRETAFAHAFSPFTIPSQGCVTSGGA